MSSSARSSFRSHRAIPLAALASVLVIPAASAAPQVWGEQVGTSTVDILRGVTADGAGGTYECGAYQGDIGGPHLGQGDAFVTRRDGAGNVVWSQLVATPEDDGGVSVASDAAGGVFLAGNMAGLLDVHWSMNYDAFVARFDAAGNQLWLQALGIADYEEVTSCAPDGAGGVFVTGLTYRDKGAAAFQNGDLWLARLDAGGSVLWIDRFGSTKADFVARVESDGSGGALLCGSTAGDLAGPLAGTFDGWYAHYDGAGNQQALQQFGFAAGSTSPSGVALDGAGGFFLSVTASSFAMLRHYDGQGNFLSQTAYGLGLASDVAADGQGGAYLLGSTQGNSMAANAGGSDVWIRRVSASGAPLDGLQFGSKGFEQGAEIASVGAGVVVGGYSWGPGALFGPLSGSYKGWVGRFEDCDFDAAVKYCNPLPNSTGKPALLGHLGSTRVSNNDFALFAKECPTFETGVFLMATGQNELPFGNGKLCVGGAVQRLGVTPTLAGVATQALDFDDPSSPASQISVGSTWNFQFWYRDSAAGGAGFNLSSGLSTTFCP